MFEFSDMIVKSGILLFLFAGILASIASKLNCPSTTLVQERKKAFKTTRKSIQQALSITPGDDAVVESDSQLYQAVAKKLNRPISSDDYEKFLDSIKDIAVATKQFCDTRSESVNISSQAAELIQQFRSFMKKEQFQEARKVYGKLLCLRSLSTTVRSRRGTPGDLTSFFDSLTGEQLDDLIFYYSPVENQGVVLAFVVDNTGSMNREITAVKNLILSFIKTERREPKYYMLSTFSDPITGRHA